MATYDNPVVLDLMSTFGAVLVGSFLSAVIWGCSSFQTFLYFMHCGVDHGALKALVAFLWCLDTASEVMIVKSNFKVLIRNWGDLFILNQQQIELMDHSAIEAAVVYIVQLWFIRRIYLVNKKHWILPIILVVLASWDVVGIILYLVYGYGRSISTLSTPRELNINLSIRAASVAVDIAVAVIMVWTLAGMKNPQLKKSQQMINRVIVLTINSTLLTAITASVTLILLAASPTTLYYTITELPFCSLYFSTFLANLNARDYVRGGTQVMSTLDFAIPSGNLSLNTIRPGGRRTHTDTDTPQSSDQFTNGREIVLKISQESEGTRDDTATPGSATYKP